MNTQENFTEFMQIVASELMKRTESNLSTEEAFDVVKILMNFEEKSIKGLTDGQLGFLISVFLKELIDKQQK